jgi:hypothetical protein
MNCLARVGCLTVLCILAIVGWFTRDRWLPLVGYHTTNAAAGPTWESLSDAGAERTRRALEKLSQPKGPVFTNLSGGDVASYIFRELSKQLPPSTDSVQAAVIAERLYLRASVNLQELGGASVLGPLAGFLGDRERIQFGGTFRVIHPELAEYEVREIKLRELAVPAGMIPKLLAKIERGSRPAGVSADGLPIVVPKFIGDIRVANGKVTVYKTVDQ